MKNFLNTILLGLLLCATPPATHSQTPPRLKINRNTPSSALVNWTNQVGTSYHVLFSTNLAKPFSILEDAFSPDEFVTVYTSTTETPIGFFRIQVPTNTPATNVQIFSPSNSVTVSGEISIRMGAQIGAQIQGVNLYLDDALVGYLNSGGMNFNLETTHFTNGSHTVYVGIVDTANNETISSSIALNFNNPVRWLDACSMFNYSVPIDVDSDIYPADWLVSVTDTNGTIVRTITGSTTNGVIQTSWDGTDDNSQMLPVENLYQIQVDVAETSNSSLMQKSSLAEAVGVASLSSALNAKGVPEFAVEEPAPDPLAAYEEMLTVYKNLTPQEKLIYPLPPQPANKSKATVTKKMSARDVFQAAHQNFGSGFKNGNGGGPAPNGANSSLQFGSTKTLAWWENPWSSKKAVLARVPFPGTLGVKIGQNCNQLADIIETATGTVGNGRGLFFTTVQLINNGSDLSNLTNALNNQSVTAFYFVGHGNTDGNAFGTTSSGVFASSLSKMFGNYYNSPINNSSTPGKGQLITHKPFNLVFLDGCNTALGDLPEAFGIPKAVKAIEYDDPHSTLHKRAFIGWTGTVTFQFDQSHIDWSQHFWSTWLDDSQAYSVKIYDAIIAAFNYRPSVNSNVPAKSYGSQTLTWSD